MRNLHTLLAAILISVFMTANASAAKPGDGSGGGGEPSSGVYSVFFNTYSGDLAFDFVTPADIHIKSIYFGGLDHDGDICRFRLMNNQTDLLLLRSFLDDDVANITSGNSDTILLEPGLFLAAGDVLTFSLTYQDLCHYQVLINYETVN